MDFNQALQSSAMALGCEPLGGADWGDVDLSQLENTVLCAYEHGVRIFDTANVYGLGVSEERLGKLLCTKKNNVVIVTKGGIHWESPVIGRAKTFVDNSKTAIQKTIRESLQRLQLDSLPVFLIHRSDPNTPVEDSLNTLLEIQKAGVIQHFGFSNHSAQDWETLLRLNPNALMIAQFSMSLIDHEKADELLKLFESTHVKTMAYGPLGQGLLTGKYKATDTFPASDRRHRLPHFQNMQQYESIFNKLEVDARRQQISMGQAAIRWVYQHPGVNCTIVGAKTPEQVKNNLIAFNSQGA